MQRQAHTDAVEGTNGLLVVRCPKCASRIKPDLELQLPDDEIRAAVAEHAEKN